MENNQAKIQFNPIVVILIVVQAVFMIFMVVSFRNLFVEDDVLLGLEVSGIDAKIDGLPEHNRKMIENMIYQKVAEGTVGDVGLAKINMREGSLINKYYEDFNLSYVNFIVDVPETGLTYQVFYEWSDDELNKYILPNDSLVVMSLDGDNDRRQAIVETMLERYEYRLPEYEDIKVALSGNGFRIQYLECGEQCECLSVSEERAGAAITAFRDFVRGLGFSPEDLEYYFDNCQ